MSQPILVDSHSHIGLIGRLPCPQTSVAQRLAAMDCLGIELAICSDQEALADWLIAHGQPRGLAGLVARAHALPAGLKERLGRRVKDLVNGQRVAGWHTARWDATDERGNPSGSGLYFVRLRVDGRTLEQRLTLLR